MGSGSDVACIAFAVFAGGLSAGSILASKRFALENPFRTYGILQLVIAVFASSTPFLNRSLNAIYDLFYPAVLEHAFLELSAKATVAICLMFIPALAMGMILPVVVQISPPERHGRNSASLFAINIAGAAAGVLLAVDLLLPMLGINRTILLTALLNAITALIGLFFTRRFDARVESAVPNRPFRAVYLLFLLTGFVVAAYVILWIRALTMVLGSSVFSLAAILVAFLFGLAVGSASYSSKFSGHSDPYQIFSMIQFRVALSALFFVGVFMGIPFVVLRIFQTFYFSFPLFQIAQFLLIAALLFYATFFAGASFPAALQFFREQTSEIPAQVAIISCCSTMGAVLGSLFAGFLLIPWLGVERSIRIVALMNLILGMACFRKTLPTHQDRRVLLIGAAVLALLLFLPPWNRSILNAGFYSMAYRYTPHFGLPGANSLQSRKLLFYAEGIQKTVAVVETKGTKTLLINGRPEASSLAAGNIGQQLMLAHLPALIRGKLDKALVIGLRSGVTAGALADHLTARIDCVEAEKEIAHAAGYFAEENHDVLHKTNFHLVFDDGKNFLQHSREQYDLITSEPETFWISGTGNLLTRDFFQQGKDRLGSNGIICQRIPLYQIAPADVAIFLRTFHSVFPYAGIWIVANDLLVVGANHPVLTPAVFLQYYIGDERIIHLLPGDSFLNTDDHPVLEFSIPQSFFSNRSAEIIGMLRELGHRVSE